jgi:hypothetical protein
VNKPSVGRIVHFVYGGNHFAAIITHVWSDNNVNLFAFDNGLNQLALSVVTSVTLDELKGDYTWHWPEKI